MANNRMVVDKFHAKTTLCRGFRTRVQIVRLSLCSQMHSILLSSLYLANALGINHNKLSFLPSALRKELPTFWNIHPLAPCNRVFDLLGGKNNGLIGTYFLRHQLEISKYRVPYFLSIVEVFLLQHWTLMVTMLQSIFYIFGFLAYRDNNTKVCNFKNNQIGERR